MKNANNTIAQAIRNAITEFKSIEENPFTGAKGDDRNEGGFSLNVFFDQDTNYFYSEVEFSQDTSKTVWIDNGTDDKTVNELWANDETSQNAIDHIVENFDQDWIQLI